MNHYSSEAGVAIGAGWQSVVAWVNIGCYYLIGVPIGALLGYVAHLEVKVMDHHHHLLPLLLASSNILIRSDWGYMIGIMDWTDLWSCFTTTLPHLHNL